MKPRLLVLLAFATALGAHAQDQQYTWEEFSVRLQRSQTVPVQGPDLLGDQINLSNGALSFEATDVELPGNDALPVRVTRKFTIGERLRPQGMMADWEIQLPNVKAQVPGNWEVGKPATGNRCTSDDVPGIPYPFALEDVWHGIFIDMPGYSGELLRTLPATTRPNDGKVYLWTGGNQIHVSCLTTTKNGSGEGFLAVAPDGTRYWFDWMAQKGGSTVKQLEILLAGRPITHFLARRNTHLYVTRIEDRFGNYVNYTYSNAWYLPARLTSISASDGRTISLSYSGDRVASISNGSRVWSYGYGTTPRSFPTLTQVTLPDASAWIIALAPLTDARIDYLRTYPGGEVIRTCFSNEEPQNSTEVLTGSVTHPSGAHGTFRMELFEHGRSSVPISCKGVRSLSTGGGTLGNDPNDDVNIYAISAYNWTLMRKTLDGPGVPSATWNYGYTPNVSYYFHPGTSYDWPVCPVGFNCGQPPCTSDSCAQASITTVNGPAGERTRYHFGNTYQYNEGKLIKVEHGLGASALSTTSYVYDLSQANQSYPARYGQSTQTSNDGFGDMYHRPLISEYTIRQNAQFSRSHSLFNVFAQPLRIRRESTLGHQVTEDYTYENNLNKWVLGQVKTVSCVSSSRPGCSASPLLRETVFDPVHALPQTESRFGQTFRTLGWDTTAAVTSGQRGTLSSVTDGRGYTTTLMDWYRGVPRTIRYPATPEAPSGATRSAIVNALGQITQVTDELGYATGYSYDAMGRLSNIAWPTGDSTVWSSTSRSFVKVNVAEFGLPAGHWRLTESTGNRVKDTYYDGLWRPVLTRERDAASSATTRYVKRSFDAWGRETFVSYPSASSFPGTGTWTLYDALGRPTSVSQDSELGLLTTSTQYLPGFRTQVTNPRGYQTNTWYQAFDQPTFDAPTSLSEPGGVTTTISRDAFGKPLTVTRSGTWSGTWQSLTRSFVYTPQQRLCKRIDPESGATLLDYDAAGNLLWSARSTSLTSTASCQTGSVGASIKSQRGYDARSRLSWISHPAFTAGENFTYYADGALHTASTTDGGTWTYAYNKRRLPTSETLTLGARTFALGYGYTSLGDLATLSYPSGLSVGFAPNALGQPQQAGVHASGASYHPGGQLAGFTYGNGLIHSQTLNARGLPQRIRDRSGAASRLDYTYSYDAHGNVTSLLDGVNANEDRSLAYDARDRPISATAPNIYGAEIYEYDIQDNVRRVAGYPNGLGGYVQDHRYQYDTNQRLSRIDNELGVPQWYFSSNGFGEALTRTGHGQTWNYQWNAAGRMTRADRIHAGSTWEDYVYDAHGHRTRSTRNTGTTRHQIYSRAGQLLYVEDTRDNQRIDYIHLNGKLVAQRSRPISGSTATLTYHHTDHIGSANVETNPAGAQTQRTVRMPYGAPYSGTYREGPGFAGHVTDTQTNLTYMQQRYYDPIAQRFLSPDPVDVSGTNGGNFNRYWYANNNPYKFVDPNGEASKVAWLVRLTANGMRKVARLSHEQAVQARRSELNVLGDRQQVSRQIETAAHGKDGQLRHVGHELGDGSKGLPHYQTEGVKGHAFWGKVSVAALVTANLIDKAADAAEYIPDLTPRPAEQTDIDRWNNAMGTISEATGVPTPSIRMGQDGGFQGYFRVQGRLDSKRLDEELKNKK